MSLLAVGGCGSREEAELAHCVVDGAIRVRVGTTDFTIPAEFEPRVYDRAGVRATACPLGVVDAGRVAISGPGLDLLAQSLPEDRDLLEKEGIIEIIAGPLPEHDTSSYRRVGGLLISPVAPRSSFSVIRPIAKTAEPAFVAECSGSETSDGVTQGFCAVNSAIEPDFHVHTLQRFGAPDGSPLTTNIAAAHRAVDSLRSTVVGRTP